MTLNSTVPWLGLGLSTLEAIIASALLLDIFSLFFFFFSLKVLSDVRRPTSRVLFLNLFHLKYIFVCGCAVCYIIWHCSIHSCIVHSCVDVVAWKTSVAVHTLHGVNFGSRLFNTDTIERALHTRIIKHTLVVRPFMNVKISCILPFCGNWIYTPTTRPFKESGVHLRIHYGEHS